MDLVTVKPPEVFVAHKRLSGLTLYLQTVGHCTDRADALFRPIRNNRQGDLRAAMTPDGVYKMLDSYAASLKLDVAGFGPHALRATAATNALDHEADIAKVQEWLGHANIATTRIYDRQAPDARRDRKTAQLSK